MSLPRPQISGPIEAGQSLLDSQNLPAPVTAALEYISCRLARKKIALAMVVVRRPTQGSRLSPVASPTKSIFSTMTKTISRSPSVSSTSSALSSPLASPTGSFRSIASACISPTLPNPWGISLINTCTFTQKEEKTLRQCISKAENKFSIGTGWLSALPLTTAITCPRTNDMIRRSLSQNIVLFSAEGLTLYALDHLYLFKSQLHTYSRSVFQHDLDSAVDELHRLVLASQGRRITKGYLSRAYDWMEVSDANLDEVNKQYKTAYGGVNQFSGIVMKDEKCSPPPLLRTSFSSLEVKKEDTMREGGPGTPGNWEELTPVTKGGWLCLMVGDKWEDKKNAPVKS